MHQDGIEVSLEPVSSNELIKDGETPNIPNWQPTSLKLRFLILGVIVTFLHSAFCTFLILFSYVNEAVFTFSASNTGAYLFWQLVPIILAIIPGLFWEIVYIEMCRSQPFRDLASPQGVKLKDSLSHNYLTSFSWFVPYRALKHPKKHTAIAMISIAYLLSFGVLPTTTAAMIEIHWNDDTSPTEGKAQPLIYFVFLALAVSLFTVAFAIAAFHLIRQQRSGVYGNPASIAGSGALIAESNILDKFRSLRSYESQEGIDKALGDYQLCLEHTHQSDDSYQISLLDSSQYVQDVPTKKWIRDSNEAHPWWLKGRTYVGLHILQFIPAIVSASIIDQGASQDAFVLKICTTITTLIGTAIYANWHLHIAFLQPFYELAEPRSKVMQGSSKALEMGFTGSAISNLLRKGQSFDVWWMAMCALNTQLLVIVQPASFQNRAFMNAVEIQSLDNNYDQSNDNQYLNNVSSYINMDVPRGVRLLTYLTYAFIGYYTFFALIGLLLVMTRKRKPFLPRKPYTLSSIILYLCHGTELLEDLKGMSTFSKQTRDHRLARHETKYGLGWVEDEDKMHSYVAIDRLDKISSPFRYPKSSDKTECVKCWPENAQ